MDFTTLKCVIPMPTPLEDESGYLRGIFLIAVSACMFSIASCGFLQPKAAVNGEAGHVPGIKLLVFKDGQHVAGTINLTVVPDSTPAQIQQLSLEVDSTPINSLKLNTTDFSQGNHVLHFRAVVTSPTSGLVNLQGGIIDTLNVPLVFDQIAARQVSGFSISDSDGHPLLSWSPNPFSSFLCYVIERNGAIIDTNFSEATASFLDTSYTLADFDAVSYQVGTSNGGSVVYCSARTLWEGQSLSLVPTSVSLDYSRVTGVLENVGNAVVFESDYEVIHSDYSVNDYSYLTSVSTQTSDIQSQAELPAEGSPGLYGKSLDGIRILEWHGGSVVVRDTSLQVLAQAAIGSGPPGPAIAVGLNDKLFSSNGNGALYVYAEDGAFVGSYNNVFDGPARYLSISPDGTTMLAADNKGIKRYVLSADSAVLKLQSPVTDKIGLMHCDWNDSLVFVTRQSTTVEKWNLLTLKSIGSFSQPASVQPASDVTAMTAGSKYLCVAYTIQNNNHPASIVVEYDISTGGQIRTWTLPSVAQSLMGSEDGRYIFACTSSHQWIIDLEGGL